MLSGSASSAELATLIRSARGAVVLLGSVARSSRQSATARPVMNVRVVLLEGMACNGGGVERGVAYSIEAVRLYDEHEIGSRGFFFTRKMKLSHATANGFAGAWLDALDARR